MIENEREIKGKKAIKNKHEKIRETMKRNNYSMILREVEQNSILHISTKPFTAEQQTLSQDKAKQ